MPSEPRFFAWHHLQTRIPAAWEVTLYGKDPAFGTLAFSTRHGLCAEFHWRKRGRKRTKKPETDPWRTFEEGDGGLIANCTRVDPPVDLTWEFTPLGAEHAPAVLAATRENRGDTREYTLHGIHARVSKTYDLDKVQAYPANTMIGFAGPHGARMVYRRWGLPAYILHGKSVPDFFQRLLTTEGMRIGEVEPCKFHGHEATRVVFSNRGLTPMARLLTRRAHGHGWIWHEVENKRLCTFEQIVPAGVALPAGEGCVGDV
ncbi:MAG: hypothetical protein JJU29_12460 [Verrucomicrobia bacterium]|nr:hypothetical protein [Verrucomicrobiota bacterium]MCH8512909.1 hypothetical protein [Kiritimatiellia bacterium]